MRATCQRCGDEFEARSPQAKWCSARCRKAVQRGARVVHLPTDEPIGRVEATTRARLEAADRLDNPAGCVALVLAARLDHSERETSGGMASLSRQHSAALAEALRGARGPSSPAQLRDELAERRRARGGAS